ncbi:MAG: RNA-binding protein [Chlamydiota bacterium]
MKLYVGNLPPSFSEQELKDLFAALEVNVISAKLITDRETGRFKGFGFVELSSTDEGQKAITALNGKVIGSGSIVVNEARPQAPRPDRRSFSSDSRRPGGSSGSSSFGGGNRRRFS